MNRFKISTIIPIYNVEKYLSETIDCIIKQSIGFENIQLILINDGSPDNVEDICLKYKQKFSDNIIYVKKENGGVSSARNLGMEYATGEYIHFMDSDDLISKNAYKKGYQMLKENDVDIVCFRIKMFDGARYYHGLDYRFLDGDKIVDLTEDYCYPLYHMPTALIRKELVNNLKLDTRLKVSEDLKFMSEIMTNVNKIGILASEMFYYRRRRDGSSTIQNSQKNISYYFDTPKYSYDYVLSLSEKYTHMSKYFQNVVVGDLQWRIFDSDLSILNNTDKKKYANSIRSLLLRCDDDIIINQKNISDSKKIRELLFKYNKDIISEFKVDGHYFNFKGKKILDLNKLTLNIYSLKIDNNNIYISCCFDVIYNSNYDIYAKINNKKYYKFDKYISTDGTNNLYDEDDMDYKLSFYELSLCIEQIDKLEFYIHIDGKKYKLIPNYTKFSKINNLKNSYYKKDKYILLNNADSIIICNKKPLFINVKYMFELLMKKEILPLGLLVLYFITNPFMKHNNWIVSDRYDSAGDSGEHLFKYIRENNKKKNIYYALKKNAKDYDRMKKIGKVLPINSIWYYIKYLNTELVVSSHIDGFINNPFGKKAIYLNAFCNRKFVFLQHGIIKDDLSSWLGKYNKNLDMFVCSTHDEYKSVLKNDYMYDENIVKLTGLPRYDSLLKNQFEEENLIALMPTWRSSLVGPLVLGTQDRRYNPKFKDSEYYKFYNGLINNKKLLDVLKKSNYKILFCLHPSMKAQVNDFEKNKFVDITFYPNYSETFKKSKLMITDYSSVFFDFAYLKKPIIYTQFDIDSIGEVHEIKNSGKSYFEYERDAFGDVVYNIDDAIKKIISLIENDCKMDKKYKERVDKFFAFSDDKNCERVYNEIKKLMNLD